jgi:GT2 family glycosyltransferase
MTSFAGVAVVAIGRNEGERLRRCLASVLGQVPLVVYVDSGSTDGSPGMAAGLGAQVIALDMTRPFTAARARNTGFQAVLDQLPDCRFVQFVDGDCEVSEGWLAAARDYLEGNAGAAAVFGRRKERYPEASVYNALCDAEWLVPAGDVKSCGGDVMMRVSALREAGGYRDDFIAGEEPELCVRLRKNGWTIRSLNVPMTLHDAAMTRFSQWWKRMMRGGYSFALGAATHGAPPERHRVIERRRAWIWGAILPVAIGVATLLAGPAGLTLALIYPAQIARLYLKHRGDDPAAMTQAAFLVLGKFPEAAGQMNYVIDRLLGKQRRLIEYK